MFVSAPQPILTKPSVSKQVPGTNNTLFSSISLRQSSSEAISYRRNAIGPPLGGIQSING